jgi:hypothetical protein
MGSGIDDFFKEEGVFEESQAQAVKEVVAWQLTEAMKPAQGRPAAQPSRNPKTARRASLRSAGTSKKRAENLQKQNGRSA